MPYKSLAQQRYFHANREKLEKQGVNIKEWETNEPLPERIGKTKFQKAKDKLKRGMEGKSQ